MSGWPEDVVQDAMDSLSCCASDWASSDVPFDRKRRTGNELPAERLAREAFYHAMSQPWIVMHGTDGSMRDTYAEAQALLACGWRPEYIP